MKKFDLKGFGVAIVTPMCANGQIDYSSLRRLIDYQIAGGIDFLVTLGTTGEAVTLTADERFEVIRRTVEMVDGRCPVVAGMGDNYTERLVQRLRLTDTTGLAAYLSVVPFYNKPSQEGLYQHFRSVSENSPLPIILYNIPGRCGVNMLPDTVLRLIEDCPNIVALKEASGCAEQVAEIKRRSTRPFMIFSGDDHLSIPFMQAGAEGVISVLGNAYPKTVSRLISLAHQGRYDEAKEISCQLDEICEHLFSYGNPAGIKSLLFSKGLIDTNSLRLPLVPVPVEETHLIAEIDKQLMEYFAD